MGCEGRDFWIKKAKNLGSKPLNFLYFNDFDQSELANLSAN